MTFSILLGKFQKTPTTALRVFTTIRFWVCHPNMPCSQHSAQMQLAVKTPGGCIQGLSKLDQQNRKCHSCQGRSRCAPESTHTNQNVEPATLG